MKIIKTLFTSIPPLINVKCKILLLKNKLFDDIMFEKQKLGIKVMTKVKQY